MYYNLVGAEFYRNVPRINCVICFLIVFQHGDGMNS